MRGMDYRYVCALYVESKTVPMQIMGVCSKGGFRQGKRVLRPTRLMQYPRKRGKVIVDRIYA